MKIEITETVKGKEFRRRLLARFGSRRALEAAARRSILVMDDLVQLRLLEADPRRLKVDLTTTTSITMDLSRLSRERLRILDHLAESQRPQNLSSIVRDLGRDKKNVSRDLHLLEEWGFIGLEKRGRDLLPYLKTTDFVVHLTGGARKPASKKRIPRRSRLPTRGTASRAAAASPRKRPR